LRRAVASSASCAPDLADGRLVGGGRRSSSDQAFVGVVFASVEDDESWLVESWLVVKGATADDSAAPIPVATLEGVCGVNSTVPVGLATLSDAV
jgi:hypothetical protein